MRVADVPYLDLEGDDGKFSEILVDFLIDGSVILISTHLKSGALHCQY